MLLFIVYAAGFVILPLLCLWHDKVYLPRTGWDPDSELPGVDCSLCATVLILLTIGLLWPLFVPLLAIFYIQRFFTRKE